MRRYRVLSVLVGGFLLAACTSETEAPRPEPPLPATEARIFDSDDPVERGCQLDEKILLRIWRGFDPRRSEDLTFVPQDPNHSGSFVVTNHSGPWDYLQEVPFVWYGSRHIKAKGIVETPADLSDVYPTMSELVNVEIPERSGRVLEEAIRKERQTIPKLVLFVVWDGVGRNVLEEWPDAWPNLARLEKQGISYLKGSVGSSPSITPATHANLGTGEFPRVHGATSIRYRDEQGAIAEAFQGRDPSMLNVTTFADEIDLALGNEPEVGMLAWRSWHFGMLGRGTAMSGGDADLLGLIGEGDSVGGPGIITGNDAFYSTPSYLRDFPGIEAKLDALDRADGEADGEWMGHDVRAIHDNPAWVEYQTDALLSIIEREGFGSDDVPDMLFTNYKMTDIVGHQYNMESEEAEIVLRSQDDALGEVVAYLDENVKDYVVVVTADHGHTPRPSTTGGWPVAKGEIKLDIDRHFDVTDVSLVDSISAVGIYLNRSAMRSVGVTGSDISRFLNSYTIRDNWTEDELPEGFEDRGDESMLSAAFSKKDLPKILRCAFNGRKQPPPDLNG
jgi:predicted AlkP superfamily pyrophosphatase or phosphodiesterase